MMKFQRPGWLAAALCMLILPLLSIPGVRPANARTQRIAMSLNCETLSERGGDTDCHTFVIFGKKSFFDSPLPYRLRSHAPGVTTWPVLSVTILSYREATPAPDKGEEHYRWDYRALAFWSLTDAGQTRPYIGDWFDVSSGREYVGGSAGAQDTALMRNPLFQGVAAELPAELHSAYRRVHAGEGKAPEPAPTVKFQRKGTYQGVCAEHFGEPAALAVLEGALSRLAQTLLFSPNLEGAPGPWEALLLPCAGESSDLVLRMRGKGVRAEAACTLSEPLIFSDTEGKVAQCVRKLGKDLRKELVTSYSAIKAQK